MKKTASIITALIMIMCLCATQIIGQSSYAIDIVGINAVDEYDYIIDDYYILMLDDENCSISYYGGTESNLEIPSEFCYDGLNYATVRRIAAQSFMNNGHLVSVTIPDTVEYIGDAAFYEEGFNFEKVVIPPSVTEIGWSAFFAINLTIYGYTNSTAETYAKEYNIPFESIGVIPTTATTAKATTTAKTTAKAKATTPTITTKKATIKKLTPKKKALKVTWKKVSGAQGYEIKLATNKAFTKNKKTVKVKKGSATSKTIKKLKSDKKYYVKIRAYKKVTIDGYTVTANGPWSKIKSKKVK